jgi:hypothetical protein
MSVNDKTMNHGVPSDFIAALEMGLVNDKQKKDLDFMAAYPAMQQSLLRGMTQRTALTIFNKHHGHNLQLPRFRQMLKAEKARRERDGDVVVCPTCGQVPQQVGTEVEA